MNFIRAIAFLSIFGCFSFTVQADGGKFTVTIDGSHEHFSTLAEAESAIRNGPAPRPQLVRIATNLHNQTGQIEYVYDVPENDILPIFQDLSVYPAGSPGNPICSGENGEWCYSESAFLGVRDWLVAARGDCLVTPASASGSWTPVQWNTGGDLSSIPDGYQLWLRHRGRTFSLSYREKPSGFPECRERIESPSGPFTRHDAYMCPAGFMPQIRRLGDPNAAYCHASSRYSVRGPLDQGCDAGDVEGGNPCNILSGNKRETEIDYRGKNLQFTRTYNSTYRKPGGTLSPGWRHNYESHLVLAPYFNITAPAFYVDRSGAIARAVGSGSTTRNLVGRSGAQLTRDATNGTWVLQRGGYQETFDANGRLVQIKENGRVTILNYDPESKRLASVVGPAGSTLQFEYIGDQLTRIIRPDAQSIEYRYENDRLVAVVFPDESDRKYHYEHSIFPQLLTGITDENGNRFSTYHYSLSGKAIGSEHAGGVEKVFIKRNADGSTEFTDPLGHTSIYGSVPVQHMRKFHTADSPCSTCTNTDRLREYNAYGYVTRRIDLNNTVTEYVRGSSGVELSRTEAVGTPEQRVIATQWHAMLNLPTRITEPGRITDYTYDADGNRQTETITDPVTGESRTTTWIYNSNGQVLTVDGSRTDVNDVTTFTYGIDGNLATVTNALGHLTRYTRYDTHGNPLEIVDPNGAATELEYDLRQRLIRRSVAAGTAHEATTTFDYDAVGQLVKTTLPDGAWIGYEYDAAHRMTAIHDSTGNRIDYILDAMGNRVDETVTSPGGMVFRETFRDYNELNRLVTRSGPAGSRMDYAYDPEGKRTSVTDANSKTTTSRYDALDRLFETVDALSGVTSYEYDPRDNLTQVIDPRGVATGYTYNGFNELIETDSPDAGITTYTYDKAGNRISQTDARGVTVNYEYDALNRLTFIDYPGSAQDISYEYDALPNAIGRLIVIEDETGRTEYAYDARGNLTSKVTEVNDTWLPVTYDYDNADRLQEVIYPDGMRVFYSRDTSGRITGINTVNDDGSQVPLVSDVTHAPFGPVTGLTYGNDIIESRRSDQEGRLLTIHANDVLDLAYQWDANGNITAVTNNLDPAHSQSYQYDALYRLAGAQGIYGDIGWTYDSVGNRLSKSVIPIAGEPHTETYTYAMDSNRLLGISGPNGSATYTYDENGNTLDNGEHAFSYGARNRLASADGVNSYAYNALGQRVVKQTPVQPGSGVPDEDILEQIAELEAQAETALADAATERQSADQSYVIAAGHQQQADAHAADAAQNWLEAEQNWAAYEENLADVAEAEAEIAEMEDDIEDLQAGLIYPAETPEDDAHNAPILAEIASLEAEIEDEQLDIADDTADAEEDLADALDDQADAQEAEMLAAQSQALAGQHTADGNAHQQTAEELTQQAADLQAQADALRNSAPTEPQGGTILFIYDEAGHLLGEYDELGNAIREYVWLGDRPVAIVKRNGVSMDVYYIHVNNIDAPQVVTDQNGQIVWKADYQPFGEAEEAVLDIEFNLRLPGQYRDQESGLHYNYFRSYDPGTGRYGQNDPIGLSGGLNRYAYVKANPISRFDQYGLFDAVNPVDYPNLDPGDGGVFCDGRGGFRVWVPNDWDECIRDCVVQHENMHLNHIYVKNQQSICSGKTADHRIVASTQEERLWTERIAYQTEKRCLQKKLAAIECGDACESRIRNRILFVDGKLNQEDF